MKNKIIIKKPRIIKKPLINKNTLIFPILYNNEKYDIYIDYYNLPKNISINLASEGIVALFYTISLYNNLNFEVFPEIDSSLLNNLSKIQPYFLNVDQQQNFIKEKCKFHNIVKKRKKIVNKKKTILPCTGGADSTSSIIKYKREIGACLFVLGFDIKMDKADQEWIDIVINNTKEVMNKCLGNKIPLIVVETNLWDVLIYQIQKTYNINCGIPNYAQGASVSAIIYPLSNNFNKLIMSGPGVGKKYKKYMKSMYRSEMEKLYSSSFFKIKVDDDLCRQDKIKYIHQKVPAALKNLRICTKWNKYGGLNCQQCSKCIQTGLICNLLGIAKDTSLKELTEKEIDEYYQDYTARITKSGGDKYTFLRQIDDLYKKYKKNI